MGSGLQPSVVIPEKSGIQNRLLAMSFVWIPTSVGTTVKAEGIYVRRCNIWLKIGYFQWGKTL